MNSMLPRQREKHREPSVPPSTAPSSGIASPDHCWIKNKTFFALTLSTRVPSVTEGSDGAVSSPPNRHPEHLSTSDADKMGSNSAELLGARTTVLKHDICCRNGRLFNTDSREENAP